MYFYFVLNGESESETEEFLLRYYTLRDSVPKSIAIDREFDGMEEIAEWLSQKHGSKVGITVPQRGDRAQLVAMCKSNAAETLAQKKGATVREYNVLEELRDLLGLKKLPEYIESYDISNLAGTENVAGMIVYKNGKPLKSSCQNFRHGCVVILSFKAFDFKLSVSRFERFAVFINNHTRNIFSACKV